MRPLEEMREAAQKSARPRAACSTLTIHLPAASGA